ncbi:hypothetical protein ACQW02_03575 [Humitalea sp. 24SJ18S-53]|uniref:hypothetical protein n=1 Tax=Humitalea sp. 24SJ18S-53 TaxID=3422307 RepID=UPI003D676DB8
MYVIAIILFMAVLPAASILGGYGQADLVALIGTWFVFWAVGVRLMLAGAWQIVKPSFTAVKILGVTDPAALIIVQELGFANLSIGAIGALSLLAPAWTVPAAITGGLFYALAGLRHLLQPGRNAKEIVAMVSDLFAAAVLAAFLVATALTA